MKTACEILSKIKEITLQIKAIDDQLKDPKKPSHIRASLKRSRTYLVNKVLDYGPKLREIYTQPVTKVEGEKDGVLHSLYLPGFFPEDAEDFIKFFLGGFKIHKIHRIC